NAGRGRKVYSVYLLSIQTQEHNHEPDIRPVQPEKPLWFSQGVSAGAVGGFCRPPQGALLYPHPARSVSHADDRVAADFAKLVQPCAGRTGTLDAAAQGGGGLAAHAQ